MPLSAKGKRLLAEFRRRYGAERGERIFYAKERSDPGFSRAVKAKKKRRG